MQFTVLAIFYEDMIHILISSLLIHIISSLYLVPERTLLNSVLAFTLSVHALCSHSADTPELNYK